MDIQPRPSTWDELEREADSQAFLAEMAEVCQSPDHQAMSPLLIGAWRRKPR